MRTHTAPNNVSRSNPEIFSSCDCVLKVITMQLYGTSAGALLDTGAVPYLISAELVDHPNLVPRPTQKKIMDADRSNSKCLGLFLDVPVTFGDLTVHMEFMKIKDAYVGVIIGSPTL